MPKMNLACLVENTGSLGKTLSKVKILSALEIMSWTNWFENPCTDVLPNNDVEPLFRWVWYSLRAWCKCVFLPYIIFWSLVGHPQHQHHWMGAFHHCGCPHYIYIICSSFSSMHALVSLCWRNKEKVWTGLSLNNQFSLQMFSQQSHNVQVTTLYAGFHHVQLFQPAEHDQWLCEQGPDGLHSIHLGSSHPFLM